MRSDPRAACAKKRAALACRRSSQQSRFVDLGRTAPAGLVSPYPISRPPRRNLGVIILAPCDRVDTFWSISLVGSAWPYRQRLVVSTDFRAATPVLPPPRTCLLPRQSLFFIASVFAPARQAIENIEYFRRRLDVAPAACRHVSPFVLMARSQLYVVRMPLMS